MVNIPVSPLDLQENSYPSVEQEQVGEESLPLGFCFVTIF